MAKIEQPPRPQRDTEEEPAEEARADGRKYPKKGGKGRKAAREIRHAIGAPAESPIAAKEEVPTIETAPPETGPFNTTAFTKEIESAYLKLGEQVRRHGIDPRDLPDRAWESANETFEDIKKLSEAYRQESSPEARAIISARIQRMGVSLDGSIKKKIETATKA